jgi:hypothetical protein
MTFFDSDPESFRGWAENKKKGGERIIKSLGHFTHPVWEITQKGFLTLPTENKGSLATS